MKAKVGDWIRIMGHHTGDSDRRGQIVGVHGDDGSPPFEVRWIGNDHVTTFFPGLDAVIEAPHTIGRQMPSAPDAMVLAQPVPSGARPLRARDRDAAMSAVPGEVLIEVEAAAKTGAAVNQSYTVEPESPTT